MFCGVNGQTPPERRMKVNVHGRDGSGFGRFTSIGPSPGFPLPKNGVEITKLAEPARMGWLNIVAK
jgi:hypothetical protein